MINEQVFSIIIILLAWSVVSWRTDTWPSEYLKANIDFDGMSKECYAKCGPCRDEVMQFELTDDFEHLPNSTGVRCYLHCQMVLLGVLEPNTAQLAGGKFIDLLADMDANERRIWIGMSRGCLKYVRNILDPVQFAYAWNVCAKHNDNEHYFSNY